LLADTTAIAGEVGFVTEDEKKLKNLAGVILPCLSVDTDEDIDL
jgi:hypothetical protein